MEGQLNAAERNLLTRVIRNAKPRILVEVGTWLGGGSTIHTLQVLEENQLGHLWGIEADRAIYERMIGNIRSGAGRKSIN